MKNNKLNLIILFLYSTFKLSAQEYLINPASDGGFEGNHGWTIVNHPTGENKWFIGNAEKNSGEFGAYVSNNSATQSLTSPQSANAVIYLYKDVVVPTNASSISLSFKLKNESVTNRPPRVFFAKTSFFEPTPRTNVIYSDYTTITKVLNNAQNWEPYTNTDPLVEDRQVTFSSRTLEPGESYRIMFEWSALQQGSITQTSPPTIYPTNPRVVTSSETYTPGTTTNADLVFDQDGQNYDIVWSVEGGAEIESGQGTTTIVVYHPLGISSTQTYRVRLLPNPRTPTFESNGVNSGSIAIDEVSLTFIGVPKINNLSANTAQVGANVVINGEYFDPIPANNIVYLGGMKCDVVSGDANSLTVTVPSFVGTAFFTVTNANTKLSAVSPIKFTPINTALVNAAYASHSYSNLTFENPISFSTSFSSSYDQKFALMDLDIDGKLDVVSFASNGQPNFLKNTAVAGKLDTSTFAAVSTFTGVSPTYTPNSSRSILFADFNNDGKLDIGASNNTNDGGFINPNTSTIGTGSLANSESIMASGNNYKVNAALLPLDINRDGRLDIFGVSTEQGTVRPYYTQNTSTSGSFGFETIESDRSFDLSSAYGGDFGDFDGDGAHDVVYGADGYILLFKNNTQQGNPFVSNFSMQRTALLPLPNMFGEDKAYTVKFFDVDGDGNLDIVATNATRPILHIWRNTGSDFDVEPRQDFKIKDLRNTEGLALGDLNGDGRLDIVTSDYVNGSGSKFSYLENQSTNGAVSFGESVTIIQSDDSYQQVEIADVDGDGKVDIIGANVSNGSLDVFRNRVFESGSVAENQEICIGTTTQEIASLAPGQVISGDIVYSWQSSTTDEISGYSTIANETAATLEPRNLTQTTYFRRGIASSDDPSLVYYSAPVEIKIVPLPTITEVVDVTICGTGSVPLVATTSAGETSFVNWYDAPTGGNLLGRSVSGEVFITPEITQNTTFYAEAENANGCIAAAREAVEAILNLAIPTATIGTFEDTKCDAASFTLTASTSSEAVIKWYDAEIGGNLLREGASFSTPVISANTTYWVEASNCNGASTRTAIPLTLIQTPSIVAAPGVTSCQFSDVVLTAEASAGGVLNWYENPTGGVPNAAHATINNLSATTTRYVSASVTVNGVTCESPRTPVKVTMLDGPVITNSASTVYIYGDKNSSLNDITPYLWITEPAGTTTNWYADAAATQLLLANNRVYRPEAQKTNTTYYAVVTDVTTGCQSAPRPVTVIYRGPLFNAIPNTFALTGQENIAIKASGLSNYTNYEWQRSSNQGQSWESITSSNASSLDSDITYSGFYGTSSTSATLIISNADPKLHGFLYRLKLIGTSYSHVSLTNPSILTIADVYGACDEGDLPVSDYTFSTPKSGLSVNGGGSFISDKTKLADGDLQTGLIVTNSVTFPVTSSLRFDGSDDNVIIGQPNSIQNITTGITVEAWVKPNGWNAGDVNYLDDGTDLTYKSPVVEKDRHFGLRVGSIVKDSTYFSYGYPESFKYAKGGIVSFIVHNGTKNETVKTETNAIPNYEWSHIAATYDSSSGSLRIYVNGVLTATKYNSQFSELGTGGELMLGGNHLHSDRNYNGFLDEVRIWNYPKSETEIRNDMAADVSGNPGLSAYYKFMEGEGTTLADLSGNDANGVLNNFSLSTYNSKWSTDSQITDTKKLASIVADLGAASIVNGVRLSNFNGLLDGGASVQPNFTEGYLESSSDGVNWIRQINAIPSIPLNGQTLAINDVTARYFRFRKEDQTDGAYYGLSEITFLGGGYETVPYIREALPVEKYVLSGTTLDLDTEAMAISGETIASYQWSSSSSPLDGTFTDLTDGGNISGTNTSNFIISNYSNGTPTYYRLTATQSNGCVVSTQVLVNLETTPYYSTSADTNTLNQLASWTVNEDGSAGSAPVAFAENKFFILKNSGDGIYELGADWTNEGTLKLNGNSLSLNSTYSAMVNNIEEFSNSAYVKTLGTGYLKSNVSNEPKVFPVGTSTNYSPVTITNNLGTDEVFSVSVADGVANPGSGVQDYLAKTWRVRKTTSTTSGGTNLDVTFEWDASDEEGTLGEPMVFWSSSATTSSWSSISSSNYTSVERTANSITLKGFKGTITSSDRYFIVKNAVPTITSFTPTSAGSGMEVVITGSGFTGATSVSFGGTQASGFTVDSSTQITAIIDAGANGNVTVTTPGGTVNKSYFYYKPAPTITSFTPTKTQVAQSIVITGTNFNNVREVKIGDAVVSAYKVNSSSQITANIPTGAVSGTVQVTTEGGTTTLAGFELGMPLAKAESIVSWYPANASTLDEPYTQSTRKEGAILSGDFTYSGLTGHNSSDRLRFNLPTVVGSTLNIATAPYISLKINTESLVDLERIVLQGYHASYGTKLQLRWSIDDFTTSLGEFQGYTFNSTSTGFETKTSTGYWRYTSLSLASADPISGNEEIELRIYVYGNYSSLGHFCIVNNNTNYSSNDSSPVEFKDTNDAINVIGTTKNDPGLATVLPIEAMLSDRLMSFNSPVSNSSGEITMSIPEESNVAAYNNNYINFLGIGRDTLTIKQAETPDYMPATQLVPITVKDYPVVEFNSLTAFVDDDPLTLSVNSPSQGSVTYQSSDPDVATISGNALSIVNKGVAQITVQQTADGAYLAASANAVLLVKDPVKPTPTVTWINTVTKSLDDLSFTLEKPQSNSSGLFTYYSSNPQVATVSGREVSLVGNGITVLTAVQEETSSFNATKVITLLVVADNYKTAAGLTGLNNYTKVVTDADFDVDAPTSSSTATIIYVLADDEIASISGNRITLKRDGVTKLYAYQQETGTHKAAAVASTLTVNLPEAPSITYSDALQLPIGNVINTISPVSNSGIVTAYEVWPPLPAGLSLNEQTGEITGTPTILFSETRYEVSGSNLGGVSIADFSLSVIDLPPTNLSYSTPQVFTKGQTITPLSPSVSGGVVVSYSVTPALPLGLSLNAITGEISGAPLFISDQATFTVKAENTGGETTFDLQITVEDSAPTSLSYPTPVVLSKGVEMVEVLPFQNAGGEIAAFTVQGTPLPAGLTLNAQTGAISGTPTVIVGSTSYTIRGSNSDGFVDGTIQLIINDAPPIISYSDPVTVTKGVLMTPLLPTNTGGEIIRFSLATALPQGLSFNASTGEISGTPSVLSPAATYSIMAENLFGTSDYDLTLAIVDVAPSNLTYPQNTITATKNGVINSMRPTASGGAIVSYTISPELPAGILFNTLTGEVSGTPTVLSENTTYTVTATNTGGSASTTFSIVVNDTPPSSLTYASFNDLTRGFLFNSGTPTANGGPIVSFAITPSLPAGLTLDAVTGLISGTPQVTTATLTYTITATNSGGNTTTTVAFALNKAPLTISVNNASKVYGEADLANTVSYDGFVLGEDENDLTGALVFQREPGEAVGSYEISASGLTSSSEYDITYETGNLSITKLPVTVSVVAKSKNYGYADPSLTFEAVPAVGSTLANGEMISFTGAIAREVGEDVGVYAITQNTLNNSNYTLSFTGADFTINALPVVVSAQAKSKVFGSVDPDLTYTSVPAVGSSLANGETVAFTGALSRTTGEDVGTYAIDRNTLSNSNYAITYNGADFTITKLPVTVTAQSKTKVYGEQDPTLTYTSLPVVGQILPNGETVSLTGELSRVEGENVNSYTINQNTLSNGNYDIAYTSAALEITKKQLVVTALRKERVYGESNPALTFTYDGLANGDTKMSTEPTISTTAIQLSDVGAYPISLTGGADSNYEFVLQSDSLIVLPKPLTITADDTTKEFGEVDPSLTVSYAGFVNAEDQEDLTGTLSISRASGESVGTYAITASGLTSTNYAITYEAGEFTITSKSVTDTDITIASIADLIYTGIGQTPSPAVQDGTTVLVVDTDYTLSYVDNISVGIATVTVTGIGNYSGTKDVTFDITLAPLTITADDTTKEFGEVDPSLTVSYTGFVNAEDQEDLTGTLSISRASGESVGTYAITASGLTSTNYAITYEAGEFTITSKSVTDTDITIASIADLVYTGIGQTPSPAVQDGTTVLVVDTDYTLSYVDNINVGTATVTVTGIGNYSGTKDVTFDITLAPLTITADDTTKEFGEVDPSLTVSYTGFVNAEDQEDLTGTLSISRASGESVGTYAITASGLTSTNYAITYEAGEFTITSKSVTDTDITIASIADLIYTGIGQTPSPAVQDGTTVLVVDTDYTLSYVDNINVGIATVTVTGIGNYSGTKDVTFDITLAPLTITADDTTKEFGEVDPSLTVSYTGFVNAEDQEDLTGTLSISRASGESVGTYAITASGLTSTNYAITYEAGEFTITSKSVTDTDITIASIADLVYTGIGQTPSPVVKDGATDLVKDTDYTLSYVDNINVGIATVTVTGIGNYSGTKDVTFDITLAPLTITADDTTKEFGEVDPSLTVSYTGFVNAEDQEDLTGTLSISRASGESVGTYAITASGLTSTNYAITYEAGEFTITSKSVTDTDITIASIADLVYTGIGQTPSPAVQDGTTVLVVDTDYTLSYVDNINVGTATVTVTGIGNYSGTKDVTFDITLAPLTITADDTTKEFGEVDPSLTVSYTGFVNAEDQEDLTGTLSISRASGESVGTYAITASGLTSTNYAITYEAGEFTITSKSVTDTDITIASIADLIYTGIGQTPSPAVKDGATDLVKDTDYTLSYVDNINVGIATVTVTGIGNYRGTRTVSFMIVPKIIEILIPDQEKDYGAQEPVLVFTADPILFGSDVFTGELSRASGEAVGEYLISSGTLSAGDNYTLNIQTDAIFRIIRIDSDGDGVADDIEETDGTDPTDSCDFVLSSQTVTPSTAWNSADCDSDGVSNADEVTDGTDPLNPDTDGDGVIDGTEKTDGTDALDSCDFVLSSQTVTPSTAWNSADCDSDGVSNADEVTDGTDPLNPDTDGDGVIDGTEKTDGTDGLDSCDFVLSSQTVTPSTAWNSADCDSDGVSNADEVTDGTDPLNSDSDGDGVIDGTEKTDGTDGLDTCDFVLSNQTVTPSTAWNSADCDSDGVTNADEVTDGTDPLNPDTDGDGVIDGTEKTDGTDGLDTCDFVLSSQTVTPSTAWNSADCDSDGVTNADEVTDGTNPLNRDSDGDGVIDGTEKADGTDGLDFCSSIPLNVTLLLSQDYLAADCDGDGLSNGDEIGPDVNNPIDSDNDGVYDYLEYNNYTTSIEDDLEVFNLLTPNNDGENDVFVIRNIELYPENTLEIYNRWGVKVYSASGYGQNGRYFIGISNGRGVVSKSSLLPTGTYFYILRYKPGTGEFKERKGYLYLTR